MFDNYGALSLGSSRIDVMYCSPEAGSEYGRETALDALRRLVSAWSSGEVRCVKSFDYSDEAEWVDYNRYFYNHEKPVRVKVTACLVVLEDGERLWCAYAKRTGSACWSLLVSFEEPLLNAESDSLALLCPATAYTRARKPERILAALLEANKDR